MKMNKEIYGYYSSIETKDINWLWYPYIPYGKITLIEGDPGEGKSTFALNIAALLTKGENIPDGYLVPNPELVIYQCSEDDLSDTVKPRLISAQADCSKVVYIINDDNALTLENKRIEDTIKSTKSKLFILDPIQSFLPQESDMFSMGRMRSILGKLSVTAAKYNCAMLLIGHMNKSNSGKNLYRGMGSIDIAAIARSVLMIQKDESDPTIRYMYQIKSSLAPIGSTIAFNFDKSHGFKCIGAAKNDAKFNLNSYNYGKKGAASDLLVSLLSEGAMPSQEIIRFMYDSGCGKRTLYDLKKELNIVSFKENKAWFWKLPN